VSRHKYVTWTRYKWIIKHVFVVSEKSSYSMCVFACHFFHIKIFPTTNCITQFLLVYSKKQSQLTHDSTLQIIDTLFTCRSENKRYTFFLQKTTESENQFKVSVLRCSLSVFKNHRSAKKKALRKKEKKIKIIIPCLGQ
jgi:hypothetical protein